jgi:hypothetical protein
MEGREHEMSGHRGLHRDRSRLEIADFTDHDDVWILTEESLETCRVEIVFLLVDFTLYDSRKLVLDRIFESYDFAIRSIEGREEGVESRRLTRSCRSCDEDSTIFFLHTLLDLALTRPHESEFIDRWYGFGRVEYTAYGVFTIAYGECRYSDIDTITTISDTIFSILGNFGDIEF